jgi:hypothetical protein
MGALIKLCFGFDDCARAVTALELVTFVRYRYVAIRSLIRRKYFGMSDERNREDHRHRGDGPE